MRVLVTGGGGFVGQHAVRALTEAGALPVVFGRRPQPGGIVGDVTDLDAAVSAGKDVAAVVHLAASPGYRAEEDPRHDVTVNTIGTLNVLRAARAHDLRVVYASTSHVYGVTGVVSEEAPTRPASLYGASKLAGEAYCGVFHRAYGVATTVLRFPVLFGAPVSGSPPPNVVEVFTARALAKESITLDGTANAPVDLLDVEDAAEAIVLALTSPTAIGRTYNIGSGRALSLGQLADLVKRQSSSGSPVSVVPARPAALLPVLDVRRAERELGFLPGVETEDGVARYVNWRLGIRSPSH